MSSSILIVDDEPSIREALDAALGASHQLRMASSAEEALATPLEIASAVSVIFLDGALGPGLSGDQALGQLRRRFPQAAIVYIGALGALKAPALRAAGVSLILPKPWSLADLEAAARIGMPSKA